jgi:hypothetical protein
MALACLILVPGASVRAAIPAVSQDASNPYAVIGQRNAFHLNPVPIPPPPEPPKVELPDVKLSGFLKVANKTHVLFSYTPKDKKDLPIYYNLIEGEKQGILEVLKIHEEEGEVDVRNSGTEMTLSLAKDSLEAKGPTNTGNRPKPGEHRGFGGRPGLFSQSRRPLGFPLPQRATRIQ